MQSAIIRNSRSLQILLGWWCAALFASPPATQAGQSETDLIIDEIPLGQLEPQPFLAVINEVVRLSPDFRHVAFAAEQGNQTVVYVDGVPSKRYDEAGAVCFSPNGAPVTFVACNSNKWLIVRDGQEGKPYDDIRQGVCPFLFSPNGERVAYLATEGQLQRVVVDRQEGQLYDEILPGTPIFSPDSQRVAYAARHGKRVVTVLNGKVLTESDDIATDGIRKRVIGLTFSPNRQRIALTLRRSGMWFVAVDGTESAPWEEVISGRGHGFPGGSPAGVRFSPDSRHFAYEAKRDGEEFVVVDGKEKAQGKYVGGLIFSPDSKRTAFVRLDEVKPGQWAAEVVVDGILQQPFDGSVEALSFSPDSSRLAYVARRGHAMRHGAEFLVVNGKAGKEFDFVSDISWGPVMFNPRGGKLSYVGSRERTVFRLPKAPTRADHAPPKDNSG